MGISQTDLKDIIERAKTKKDGIFSYHGIKYVVKCGGVKFLQESNIIYSFCYGFLSEIGRTEYNCTKKIKSLLLKKD